MCQFPCYFILFAKAPSPLPGLEPVTFRMLKIANDANGCANGSNTCANGPNACANGANGCTNGCANGYANGCANRWLTDD